VALVAAAGLIVGGVALPSAKAADLGGDCCADLEERVAELEATTARKGNRKMSLTITGQVHRIVLFWDDGYQSNTYYGLDSTNSSTRYIFLGSARVNPKVQIGFEIMIEIEAGGTSSKLSQLDEDGRVGSQIGGSASFNAANVDAYFGDARRAAWYIEHKDLGRMTVGRFESAGVIQTVDLGGISAGASSSFILINGSFLIRGPTGQYYATSWANIGDPASAQGRTELVRYDSPSWQGFIFSSSVAESGDYWGAMLRYANEFNGVRIAGGFGYETVRDKFTPNAGININYDTAARPDVDAWGGGLSLMHVPTGLFIQGHYNWTRFAEGTATDLGACTPSSGTTCTAGYWGQTTAQKDDAKHWLVQGGIAKNWFGVGNTALYGEYGRTVGWGASTNLAGRDFTSTSGAQAVLGVIDTELTIWGIGINQKLDAAATEIYLGYRHFNADITCRTTGANCTGAGSATGTVNQLQTEDFHAIVGGARVQF
jgi:hypothetical protein